MRGSLRAAFFLLGVFALLQTAQAQPDDKGIVDKDITAKGQVQVGVHSHKLEAGNLYQIRVEGNGFRPFLNLRTGQLYFPVDGERGDNVEMYFVPKETKTYRFLVSPDLYDDLEDGPLSYKFVIRPVPLAAKPVLQEKSQLTADDPAYQSKEPGLKKDSHFKPFPIKLKAKQFCIIEMTKGEKEKMEPFLYLEDGEGRIVASDDSGGNPTARVVYQPRRGGEFRIIATTFAKSTGAFTLTVKTQQ